MSRSITNIFCVGFVVVSFYEIMAKALPFMNVLAPDTRVGKELMAVWIALIIGLVGLHYGGIQRINNKWLLVLIGYLLLSAHNAPLFPIIFNETYSPNFWQWKPLFQILSFFLMFAVIQGVDFTKENISKIFNTFKWCALVMAGYVILQSMNIEQFYFVRSAQEIGSPTNPEIVGTLGNSTIVAAYMALLIPFLLFNKEYLISIIVGIAVYLCKSEPAIYITIFTVITFFFMRGYKTGIISLAVVAAIGIVLILLNPIKPNELFNPNGRIDVWKKTINDIKTKGYGDSKSAHPITGNGIGSFSYLWPQSNGSTFRQAHNEYLDMWFQIGLVGVVLFFMAIWPALGMFSYSFDENNLYVAAKFSFIASLLFAGATFIYQVSPHDLLCVMSFGLLNNKKLNGGMS